jgi:alpha-amylase/alpha-mannosidase (GH57 family)
MQLMLLWHFHQPYYGLPDQESFLLPWVRLHATKSYLDMASAAAAAPGVKMTANFSGSLLEQLRRYVDDGWRDRFWELTLQPADGLSEEDYHFILRHFFSLDWHTVLPRFPRYAALLGRRGRHELDAGQTHFTEQEIRDLQVLFNLAWCGFTMRTEDERVRTLVDKGEDFDEADKVELLEAHQDALRRVLPAWRELAERGQVELSVTPAYHPILPLLIDSDSARRAMPNHPMPARFRHPEDAAEHLALGLDMAQSALGTRPSGIWPSEGSVSPELLPLVKEAGLQWLASDEHVLLSSERTGTTDRRGIYEPWWLVDQDVAGFFRDHELSDLIGFSYQRTEADRASSDFAARLMRVAGRPKAGAPACVSVILDGENAWEHYPDDGRPFLEQLYRRLGSTPGLETVTPSERLVTHPPRSRVTRLHSGSWISANFRIWIGTSVKNQAWTQLQHTRRFFAEHVAAEPAPEPHKVERAKRALLRAEGSDWFWWYGDDFSSDNDALFDELFRRNLIAVHELLDHAPPLLLEHPIGGDETRPSTVAPRALISPVIDGRKAPWLDWVDAGLYIPTGASGSMTQTTRYVEEMRFGFDLERLYLRLDTNPRVWSNAEVPFVVRLELSTPDLALRRTLFLPLTHEGKLEARLGSLFGPPHPVAAACDAYFGSCFELALPFAALELSPRVELQLVLQLERDGVRLERLPQTGAMAVQVPDESFEGQNWYV